MYSIRVQKDINKKKTWSEWSEREEIQLSLSGNKKRFWTYVNIMFIRKGF